MCARPRGAPSRPTPATGDAGGDPTLPGCYLKSNDYTYYVSARHDAKEDHELGLLGLAHWREHERLLQTDGVGDCYSASCTRHIFNREVTNDPKSACTVGRVLACRCFAGEAIAVTARALRQEGKDSRSKRPFDTKNPPKFDTDYFKPPHPTEIPFPIPLETILAKFNELGLFNDATGLVLVTGSTNSAKSELTRAIIHRYLEEKRKTPNERWPHLVTFEDPIERRLFSTPDEALKSGIEYTPRQKGIDVGSLKQALEDALRQTPTVYYVGEVREDSEWADILRFAGTGHLIVATAHAGSLVEAMERIFRGVNARTAAERGQIAQKIQAVIHQRMIPVEGFAKFRVLLPSLWRRTPSGIAALVGDGLSSILPNNPNPKETDQIDRTSSFGRRWFLPETGTLLAQWKPIRLVHHIEKEFSKQSYSKKINAAIARQKKVSDYFFQQNDWYPRLSYALVRNHLSVPNKIKTQKAIEELCCRYCEKSSTNKSSEAPDIKITEIKSLAQTLATLFDNLRFFAPSRNLEPRAHNEAERIANDVRNNAIRYDLGGI